jgi:hypothetical protein
LSTITTVDAHSGGRVAAFHTAQYAANPVCEVSRCHRRSSPLSIVALLCCCSWEW